MNYRHAYHAGNHTEVFKHSVLALLLQHLRKKAQPFMVLDTHAGAGLYDLDSEQARKTGEAKAGIERVIGKDVPGAAPYFEIVHNLQVGNSRYYPGSPWIIRSLLRENDRLIACELHDEDATLLRGNLRGDRRVSVHHRDAYEAVLAFVPPRERRGLVFIDPPFEESDELFRVGDVIVSGTRKWPTGMFAAWYPIKDRALTRVLAKQLLTAKIPNCLAIELLLFPENGELLAGSGMILSNPPWQFDQLLHSLCTELLGAFAISTAQYSVEWLR